MPNSTGLETGRVRLVDLRAQKTNRAPNCAVRGVVLVE